MQIFAPRNGVGGAPNWLSVLRNPRQLLRGIIAVGVLVFLFGWGLGYIVRGANKSSDYDKYVFMGKGVIEGFNPYEADKHKNRWPPFLAIAYAPLAFVDRHSPAASRVLFLLLSYWAFYDALRIAAGRIYHEKLALWPRQGFISLTEPAIALAVLLCARYLSDSARYIQPTFILLWLSIKSLELVEAKKDIKAGFLTAIAIGLKLVPLVWIAYFVFRGRLKASVATLGWTAVLFSSPFAVIGPQRGAEFYASWLSGEKLYSEVGTRASNESVFAMFQRSVGDALAPWSKADPLYGVSNDGNPWILTLTVLFLVALIAAWSYCAGSIFKERAASNSMPLRARRIIEEGLVWNLALYASPLTWKHYYMVQIYLLLGIFAVLAWDFPQRSKRSILVLTLIIMGALIQSNIWIPFTSAEWALQIRENSLVLLGSLCYFTVGLIYLRTLTGASTSTSS